jgi:hypothetical protein
LFSQKPNLLTRVIVPVVTRGPSCWRTLFGHSLDFVDTILNKENQDTDIVKRATNILERAKTESTEVMVLTEPTRVKKVANHLQNDESNVVSDASTKTEEQSGPMNDDDDEEAKPESSPELTNQKQQDDQLEAMPYIIQDTHMSDDVINDEQQVESSNEEQEEQDIQESNQEQEEQDIQDSNQEQEEQDIQDSNQEQESQQSSEEQETQQSSEETQQSNQEEQSNHDAQEDQVSKADETKVKDDDHLSEAQTDDSKKAQPAPATNKPKNKKKNRKHK